MSTVTLPAFRRLLRRGERRRRSRDACAAQLHGWHAAALRAYHLTTRDLPCPCFACKQQRRAS